jgi:hypothetical protein
MLLGHSLISTSGRYFSKMVSTPGVWPMSPMLTVCQEERRITTFFFAGCANKFWLISPASATPDVRKNWRRLVCIMKTMGLAGLGKCKLPIRE